MRYMLMFFAAEEEWLALPDEQQQEAIARIGAWYGQQAGAGLIVEGRRLAGKGSAKTVRLGSAGASSEPVVLDGPFIESKEAIGSYCIVDVADEAAALAIAGSWPAGGSVEVRPVMEG